MVQGVSAPRPPPQPFRRLPPVPVFPPDPPMRADKATQTREAASSTPSDGASSTCCTQPEGVSASSSRSDPYVSVPAMTPTGQAHAAEPETPKEEVEDTQLGEQEEDEVWDVPEEWRSDEPPHKRPKLRPS